VWTNWSESVTIKYVKNTLGHYFTELMMKEEFCTKIKSFLDRKDSWHLSKHNAPLSMVYIQVLRGGLSSKRSDDKWINNWWKKDHHHHARNFVHY